MTMAATAAATMRTPPAASVAKKLPSARRAMRLDGLQLFAVLLTALAVHLGGVRDALAVLVRDFAHHFRRRTHHDDAVRYHLVRRHQRTGGHDAVAADARAIEHDGAVRDHRLIAHRAAVQESHVADGGIAADEDGKPRIDVDDRAVLHVAAVADLDPVVVSAQDGVEPDTRLVPEAHAADELRARSDIEFRAAGFEPTLAEGVDHVRRRCFDGARMRSRGTAAQVP